MAKKKAARSKKAKAKKGPSVPKEIVFHYIKAADYRTYAADGIFGGITAGRKLFIEFFLQRPPIPQQVVYKVNPKGSLGDEIHRVGKEGIVREVETGVVMDMGVAIAFKRWLDEKIELFEKAKGEE